MIPYHSNSYSYGRYEDKRLPTTSHEVTVHYFPLPFDVNVNPSWLLLGLTSLFFQTQLSSPVFDIDRFTNECRF